MKDFGASKSYKWVSVSSSDFILLQWSISVLKDGDKKEENTNIWPEIQYFYSGGCQIMTFT